MARAQSEHIDVVAGTAHEQVVAGAPVQGVVACQAIQGVVAGATARAVVAGGRGDRVVAVRAVEATRNQFGEGENAAVGELEQIDGDRSAGVALVIGTERDAVVRIGADIYGERAGGTAEAQIGRDDSGSELDAIRCRCALGIDLRTGIDEEVGPVAG